MKNKILTTVLTSLFLYNTQLLHAFNQQNTLIKHALAWHEAGHALSFLYHPSSHLVHQVSIQPNISQKSLGHVYSIKTDNSEATIEELENVIISALAGGVAEQVYQQHNMLINLQDILKFISILCC